MSAASNRLENMFIDWLLRGQNANNASNGLTGAGAAAGPSTLYVALWVGDPTDTATGGAEVTGTGYARVAVTSSLANWSGTQGAGTTTASTGTSGQSSNNNAITFGSPTSAWGTITHFALFDALTTGNMVASAALTASKTVNSGDPPPTFAAGALVVSIA